MSAKRTGYEGFQHKLAIEVFADDSIELTGTPNITSRDLVNVALKIYKAAIQLKNYEFKSTSAEIPR